MKEPKKPTKKLLISKYKTLDFPEYFPLKEMSLNYLLEWCKNNIPKEAEDVKLTLAEEWFYDDCTANIEFSWKEEVDNPKYEKQLAAYEKKLVKWMQSNLIVLNSEGCAYYNNESKSI